MKIAIVIERMSPGRGGRETSVAQVARELAQRGQDVTIICQAGDWQCDGVPLVRLGARGACRLHRLRNFIAAVRQEIGGGKYDVVHATLPVPGANVYQLRGGAVPAQRRASLARRGGIGRALARLSEPMNLCRRYLGRLERTVMADPRCLCLPVSQMVACELDRFYARRQNVQVVYNAVDVPAEQGRAAWRAEMRARIGASDDAAVFVTVANNPPLKGVPQTIRAFALHAGQSGRSRDRLIVIGRRCGACRGLAQKLGVDCAVHFAGPVDDIFRWYSAADALVLLSWYDPCSRCVLEAVRWGLPAITTTLNGAAEVLAGGAGVVVRDPSDIPAAAAAMARLSAPPAREACRQACRVVADTLSIQRHVDELLKAYACLGETQ